MGCSSHDCGCKGGRGAPAPRRLPVLGRAAPPGTSPPAGPRAVAPPAAHAGTHLDPALGALPPPTNDAPMPIPWLGKAGPVEALDAHLFAPPPLPAGRRPTPAAPTNEASDVASTSAARRAEAAKLQREVVEGAEAAGAKAPAASADVERAPAGADAAKLERTMAGRAVARLRATSDRLGLGTPRDGGPALASAASVPMGGALEAKPARPKKLDPKRPGSGIPARRAIRILVWVRRFAQAGFFALFMYFLFQTTFRGSFNAAAGEAVRLPLPVEAFLLADPFVAAMTLLSTHTVYRGLLWSLGLLALTLVFGRVFCGWICPFGTLHHFTAWLWPSRVGRGGSRVDANKTHGYQRAKYYLLYFFLVAAAAGSALGGLFDPICVVVRAIGLAVLPAAQYVTGHGLSVASESNSRALQAFGDGTQDLLAAHVWNAKQFYYHHAWLIGFLFVAVLFMNRFIPRFWCRVLCPLGAFLGVFARYALFGMEKDHAKCTDCNLCLVNCQGADSPQGGVKHRQDECHMCLNCEAACPEDVIKFRLLPSRGSTITKPDTERRTALAVAGAGVIALPAMRIADGLDANYHSKVIRPPGSVEEREFLERCIRCAECMKVCPNNALHPALFEAGVEGLWTPILIARIGYCEHSCVLCGQACPTGAIQKITEKEKQGIGQAPVRIGTAFYDHGRCLPWAMSTPCIVCEEFCPTSPKAIWVEEVDIPKRDDKPGPDGKEPAMLTVHVQRPHVDPALCIGCGACEKVCPVQDQPAVYVTSVGETRSKTNVILLEGESYNRT
ncbi:MAG TPA: 4Fe-4S binding protein [Polyangiaceae bacterium]|nr:4Fe-4S binding protein [Polyangiaceae bacterium]